MRTAHSLIVSAVAATGLMTAMLLSGCSTPSTTSTVDVSETAYPSAFDAARDVLRDMKFDLERIDARAGVISTMPKSTAGLATPWDREQQTAQQEVEDMLQHQQRVVRITFEPMGAGSGVGTGGAGGTDSSGGAGDSAGGAGSGASAEGTGGAGAAGWASATVVVDPAPLDLVEFPAATVMRVNVTIERVNRPHWRVDSTSIRLDTYAYDPVLTARDMQPRYEVAIAEDRDFAARLATLIRERVGANAAANR